MNYFDSPHYGSKYLHFFPILDQGFGNLKAWKRARSEAVESLFDLAQRHLVGDNPAYPYDSHDYSLAWAQSLLSLIAILISKEFDDILEAIALGTVRENRTSESILQMVSSPLWVTVNDHYGLAPVRVFDHTEKKMFCTPADQNESSWAKYHADYRVLLSIDPFISPEDAATKVKEIVKKWKEERFAEEKKSWLEMGDSDEEAEELTKKESLHSDHQRANDGKAIQKNKKIPNCLRRLRVYWAKRKGSKAKGIMESKWWANAGDETLVSRDNKNALNLIKSALAGKPLLSE